MRFLWPDLLWLLLIVPAMLSFALWKAMEYGMIDRHDPPDDPDFF